MHAYWEKKISIPQFFPDLLGMLSHIIKLGGMNYDTEAVLFCNVADEETGFKMEVSIQRLCS